MAKTAKLTNAEKQRRYRAKRKLDEAKENAYKEAHKLRNLKRKKIGEMSQRAQRKVRKEWNKRQEKCRNNRKIKETTIIDLTKESEPQESMPQMSSKVKRLKYRLNESHKDNKQLRKRIEQLEKQSKTLLKARDMYKKRASRQKENVIERLLNTPDDLLSPRSNVSKTLELLRKKRNEGQIARRLVFQETVIQTMKAKYQDEVVRDTKRNIGIVCLSQLVKNYRLKSVASKSIGLQKSQRLVISEIKKQSKMRARIQTFFLRTDVSRHSAGIKETITRKGLKMQKRYLMAPMKDLYKKFKKHHSNVSYTTFTRYRPFHVCKPICDTRDTCLCKQHVNTELKAKKLKQLGLTKTSDPHLLTEEITCDKGNMKCMYGKCNECKNLTLQIPTTMDSEELEIQTKWKKWDTLTEDREKMEKNKKVKFQVKVTAKVTITGTKQELLQEFIEDLRKFKVHIFNIKKQNEAYKKAKDELKHNEAVIHVDFSENYQCKLASEIQGFHFGASRKQCSIHTGVLYVKGQSPLPFATLSENLDHGPEAIWAHLKPILEIILTDYSAVNVIHFFSDGPSNQYKQKKNFYLFNHKLYEYGFKAGTWNYFETSHGKGAPDGVGGALKRGANMHVANGNDIVDPKSLYAVLKNKSKVKLFFIELSQFDIVTPENLKPIPGTHQIHQLTTTKIDMSTSLAFRNLSCFCADNDWIEGHYCTCMFEAEMSKETDIAPKVAKKSVYKAVYETTSESSGGDDSRDDITEEDSGHKCNEMIPGKSTSDTSKNDLCTANVRQGVYVLVQYLGCSKISTKYRYVGVCQENIDEDDGEVKVMFLNVVGEDATLFKVNEKDICYVQFNQILKILPAPNLKFKGNRVFYKFAFPIDVYEKN